MWSLTQHCGPLWPGLVSFSKFRSRMLTPGIAPSVTWTPRDSPVSLGTDIAVAPVVWTEASLDFSQQWRYPSGRADRKLCFLSWSIHPILCKTLCFFVVCCILFIFYVLCAIFNSTFLYFNKNPSWINSTTDVTVFMPLMHYILNNIFLITKWILPFLQIQISKQSGNRRNSNRDVPCNL